jgi:hypothetical protein
MSDEYGQAALQSYLNKLFNSSAGAVQDTPGIMARQAGDYATDTAAQGLGALPDIGYGAAVNIPEAVQGKPLSKSPYGTDWWNEQFKHYGLQSHEVDPTVHAAALATALLSPVGDTLKAGEAALHGAVNVAPKVANAIRRVARPLENDAQHLEREYPMVEKAHKAIEKGAKGAEKFGYGVAANAELYPGSFETAEAEPFARGGNVDHAMHLAHLILRHLHG